MEKVINIDGRDIKLKTNGAFLYKYKDQFHRDGLKDIIRLQKMKVSKEINEKDVSELKGEKKTVVEEIDLSELDVEIFYNFFWIMAKQANPDLPQIQEYLSQFDVFPILDILPDVLEMTMLNLQTTKKK